MLVNPSSLYGGNAFKIDMQPAVNYFLKRQAQEQAKEKTLENYFTTLTDKASPTGMRTDLDGAAYEKSIQDFKDFWTVNKDKILKGDVQTTAYAQELGRIPSKIIAESKEAMNTSKMAAQVGATGNIKENWTDETIGIDSSTGQPLVDPITGSYIGLNAHNQPIYIIDKNNKLVPNPKYKHFDLSTVAVNPKILSGKEMQDYLDNSTSNIKPSKISLGVKPDPKNKLYEYEEYEIKQTPESLKAIGDRASDLYNAKEVKYTFHKNHPFKEWSDQNAAMFTQANDLYKQIYGKDIENEKELYTGLAMQSKNQVQKEVGNSRLNPIAMKNLDFQYSKKLEQYKKSLNPTLSTQIDQVKTPFEEIPDGTYGKVIIKGGYVYNAADGKPYTSAGNGFDIKISKDKLPTGVLDKRAQGVNINLIDDMDFNVVNGVIQGAKNADAGLITRGTLLGDQLKKLGVKNTGTILLNSNTQTQKKAVPSGSSISNLGF